MRSLLQRTIAPLLVLCLLGGVWLAWHLYLASSEKGEPASDTPHAARTIVELTEAKLSAAGIETGKVEQRSEARFATIPGRVTYDEAQHVEIRVAMSGVITKLLVQPGDAVERDQLLAIMSSPEIGSARADSLRRSSELEIAMRQQAWEESRRIALEKMVKAIVARDSPAEIRTASVDQQLGTIRERLLSAYSDLLLAESQVSRTQAAVSSGALPGKTSQERQSRFESVNSALQAIIEQSRHDTAVSCQAAKTATEDAERRYRIAVQHVATLLGSTGSPTHSTPLDYVPTENLSIVEIRSPLGGTVEQRLLSETERASVGDPLFVLANTRTLWISAQVREGQWASLTVKPNDPIRVTLPAFGNESFETKVSYLGREVDPATNSIPIVLSIENTDGRLRPGVFARVHLPLGASEDRLMIPESAISQHEGLAFVFRPIAANRFERVDVELGAIQNGWAEVTRGLKADEPLVVRGEFALKSELLLESEE